MKMKLISFMISSIIFSNFVMADIDQSSQLTSSKVQTQTTHSFEDLLVQGKYHFSDESLTTVEEDKVLNALLGVRLDFKDKLKKSKDRN